MPDPSAPDVCRPLRCGLAYRQFHVFLHRLVHSQAPLEVLQRPRVVASFIVEPTDFGQPATNLNHISQGFVILQALL